MVLTLHIPCGDNYEMFGVLPRSVGMPSFVVMLNNGENRLTPLDVLADVCKNCPTTPCKSAFESNVEVAGLTTTSSITGVVFLACQSHFIGLLHLHLFLLLLLGSWNFFSVPCSARASYSY